ncbi:hypothetical protein M011DRAFT_500930 [Sporormia fimetaria CBS 119925]|uniref:Uncharacterized protein n=1 Tax=Sporormia fimetaria CBS 119925 TaxID=1340428 RepID=A0A6A6VCW0_9PLEO|nr:hypothetical protein M011DRAFT_500930 [Sporormia fimetaria CBS 119925]
MSLKYTVKWMRNPDQLQLKNLEMMYAGVRNNSLGLFNLGRSQMIEEIYNQKLGYLPKPDDCDLGKKLTREQEERAAILIGLMEYLHCYFIHYNKSKGEYYWPDWAEPSRKLACYKLNPKSLNPRYDPRAGVPIPFKETTAIDKDCWAFLEKYGVVLTTPKRHLS